MSCCHGIGATETSKSIRQLEYVSDRYAVFTGCLRMIELVDHEREARSIPAKALGCAREGDQFRKLNSAVLAIGVTDKEITQSLSVERHVP